VNILQITKYFYPAISFGGPVQCTYYLSKYLVKRGHEVTVYATDALDISTNARIRERFMEINGVKVFYFRNVAKSHGFFISPEIIHALRQNLDEFDIVHLHEYRTFQNLAFYYSNRRSVPYVLSCHGEYTYKEEPWDYFLLRRLFNHTFGRKIVNSASKLIALTQFEETQFLDAWIERDKIVVVPNGIAPEDFSDVPPSGSFRTSYGIGDEEIILYLGRIHKSKGIDTLVEAFSSLSEDRNGIRLVLAGPDDGFSGHLKNVVAKLHLKDKVLFTGPLSRKQVLAAYNDATVVAYPSVQEGFPIVPLEACAMGKPVIVSRIQSMAFIKKAECGLEVEYGNEAELREALDTLIMDQPFAKKLGQNGRIFVFKNFNWDIITKKIENVYLKISE